MNHFASPWLFVKYTLSLIAFVLVVDISAIFWHHTSPVGQAVPFQVLIRGPKDGALSEVEFASVEVKFSGFERKVTVYHATDGFEEGSSTQRVQLDDVSGADGDRDDRTGWLRWGKDGILVLQGLLANSRSGEVKVREYPCAYVTSSSRVTQGRICDIPYSRGRLENRATIQPGA